MTQLSKLYQDLQQEIPKDIPQKYLRGRPRLAQQNSSSDNERGIQPQKQHQKRISQPLEDKSQKHYDGIRTKRTQPPRRVCISKSKPNPTRRSKRKALMLKRKTKKRK